MARLLRQIVLILLLLPATAYCERIKDPLRILRNPPDENCGGGGFFLWDSVAAFLRMMQSSWTGSGFNSLKKVGACVVRNTVPRTPLAICSALSTRAAQ